MHPPSAAFTIGDLLRDWRQRRRLSQSALAGDAEVSTRHLSFIETGRALPSREMVLRLAERLDVPPRERNRLLGAAGYAPMYRERRYDDAALADVRSAIEQVLAGHEPYPALVIDRHWTLVAYNRAVPPLLEGIEAALLQPPVNVLRLSLHPQGLAPRIVNLGSWRRHLLARLRQQVEASGDPVLAALADELSGETYATAEAAPVPALPLDDVVVALRVRSPLGVLSLISTTTVFGTPVDVLISELALETFLPGDAATREILQRAFTAVSGAGVGTA